MAKPLVAIVGRPNVGKSMLFNKLVGRRLSIVEDTPGVTRDRLYAECEWRGRAFDIVDTGGIEPGTTTQILSFMRKQAEIAIQNATVIVFLCDIKTGLTAADQDVANMLLRARKPVVLAVNKMDQVGMTNPDIYEFYNLGLGDPIAVSAVHGHGTGDLLDACFEHFPPEEEEEEDTDLIKVAVIGKPNVASPPSSTGFWGRSGSSSPTWQAPPGMRWTAISRTKPASSCSSTPPACERRPRSPTRSRSSPSSGRPWPLSGPMCASL